MRTQTQILSDELDLTHPIRVRQAYLRQQERKRGMTSLGWALACIALASVPFALAVLQ